ncbi:hypothetical protein MMRN_32970 [Mycobacterium marinum]|nr:hypothetical protein MMRN_32970 [Mycobacterium marinum]
MRLLAPGGALFIGDVRNLGLLRAFTTKVLCTGTAGANDAAAVMRERVRRRCLPSKNCCWRRNFSALPQYLPDIAAVDIQLKRMQAVNELSCYRYEVVLRKGPVGFGRWRVFRPCRGNGLAVRLRWVSICRSTARRVAG